MAKKKKRYGYKDGDENAKFAPGGSAAKEWQDEQRDSFTRGRTINPSDTSVRFNTEEDKENYKPIRTETYQTYMANKLAKAKEKNPNSRVHITANDLSSYSNARAKLFNIDPTANLKSKSEFTSQYKAEVDQKSRLRDMVQLAQGLDLNSAKDQVRKSYNDINAVKSLANTRTNAEGLLRQVNEYRKLYGDSKELKVLEDRAKGITDYINTNAKGGSAVSQAAYEELQAPITKSPYDLNTQTKDEVRAKYKAINDLNIEEKYGKAGDLGYEGVKNIKAETPAEADWKEEKQLQLDPIKKYEDNKKELEQLLNEDYTDIDIDPRDKNNSSIGKSIDRDRIYALQDQNAQILSQYAEDIIAKAKLTDSERRKLESGRSFDLSDNEFRWDIGDKAKNEVTLNRKEMIDVLTKRGISEEEASLLLDYEKELDKENERQAAINAGELRRRTDSELGNLTEDIARTIGQPIISPLERIMGVSGEYAHAEQLGRQQAREKYYEDDAIGQALYDFGETAGTIVGSSLLGGAAAVPFTTKAVEDSYYNALDKGATESDAMNYAATNGITTGIIYGIGLKGVNKLLSKSVKGSVVEGLAKEIVEGKPTSSLGKAILKNVGTNAVKEGGIFAGLTTTTQIADTLNQVINLGKKSDFNQMVEAYKQQGMSEDEAWQNTVLDISKQIGQGALESFASGAIMGAGGALIGGARQAKTYNEMRDRAETLKGEYEKFTTDTTSPYFDNVTDQAELEAQYRQKAKELHPDVAEGNEDAFNQLVQDKQRIEGILTGERSNEARTAIDNWENFVNEARDILGLERVLTTKEREGFVSDYEDIKTKLLETKTEVEKSNADQEVKDEVINNIDNEIARVDTAVEATADIVVPEENTIGKSKSGKPIYIDEVNGTDVTFVDSEGNKVTDYELDDTPQTELMELAIDKDYNTDTTKSMIKGFELANTDNVEAYADNYDVFYAAGKDSSIKNFKDALAKAPELTSALEIVGTDAAGKAFSEGRKQVSELKLKGLRKMPKGKFTNDTGKTNAATEYAEMFAIFSGGDVVATENPEKFISSKVEPGSIRGVYIEPEGKIIIDTKYTSFIRALNHEGKHLTDNFAIDEAKIVSDACMNYARNELGIKGIDDAIKNLQDTYEANGQKISYTEAQSEFINNIVGTAMASPEGIEGLVGEFAKDEKISDAKKQSVISKFIEWIKNLIAKLKEYAKEGGAYENTEFVLDETNKAQRQDIINKQIDALKASRKILEEMSAELEGTTDTSEQFSFAGEKAETADLSKLEKAKELYEQDKSKEEILKETGWFKGQDGKWRFEIDDSKMKIKDTTIPFGKATLSDVIEAKELFKAYPFLKNVKFDIINFLSNSLGQFSETENTISLNSDFFENSYAIKRRKEILNSEEYKKHSDILTKIYEDSADKIKKAQSEVLRANELDLSKDENFKKVLKATDKYNNLKSERDEKVNKEQLRFNDTEAGAELLELSNDMSVDSINSYKADEAKEVILHEVQHAIQRAENFATGASPSYWRDVNQYLKGMTKYDEAIFNQLDKKRLDLVKKIKKEFKLDRNVQSLMSSLDTIRYYQQKYKEQLNVKKGEDIKYYKEDHYNNINTTINFDKIPRKALYKYMDTFNAISEEMSAIRDNALKRTEKDAFRLYEKTAGEIEARDTESRRNLTAEERLENYPESAKPQEVYFAGKGDLNKSEKYSLTQEQQNISQQYDKAVADNDTEKAAKLVEEYAKTKGYDTKVYHGTNQFGFTQIDVNESDDNISFFTTDDIRLAQTYSGKDEVRRINKSKGFQNLSREEQLDLYKKQFNIKDSNVQEVKPGDVDTRKQQLKKASEKLNNMFNKLNTGGIEAEHLTRLNNSLDDMNREIDKLLKADNKHFTTHLMSEFYQFADLESAISWVEFANSYLRDKAIAPQYISSVRRIVNDLTNVGEYKYYMVRDIDNAKNIITPVSLADLFRNAQELNKGTYEFYANTDNFAEVDAKGNGWAHIPYEVTTKKQKPLDIYFGNTTRDVAEDVKNKGYDGVLITNVVDNGGRGNYSYTEPTNVYIFFNPVEQVKSADPITYDDNGNVIPLAERFSKDHDDIRYSVENNTTELVSDKDEELEVQTREKELQDANKVLADTMLELRDKRLNFDSANKIVSDMKKNFNIDLSKATIKGELSKVTDAIQSAKGNINSPKVQNAARDFIKNMMRYSKGEIDEYNQSILDNIKKTPILLSDDLKSEIQDYGYWFRLNQGKIMIRNNGIPLDRQWVEWSDMYPAIFDATISDKDQPYELEKIINTLSEGIPFDDRPEAMEAYKTDLLLKIAKQLDVNNRNLTKAYNRVARLLNNDYKKRVREALREQRDYHNAEIAEMKLNEKLRGREQRIRKETTKVRRDNIKLASKLKRAMTSPTTKNRVPFVLQEPLINFLKVIDAGEQKKIEYYNKQIGKLQDQLKYATGSQYDEILNQIDELKAKKGEVDMESAFIALERDYKKAADELEANGELSQPLLDSLENITGKRGFSESAIKGMSQAAENFGGRTIYDLYLPEQKELNRVLKMLQTEIKNYNKIIDASIIGDNGQALHISQVVKEGAKQIRLRDSELAGSDNKAKRVVGKVINKKLDFSTKNLRPDVLFNKLFGYHKNNLGQQIYEMLEQGNIDMLNTKMAAINELNKMFETKEDRKHAADIQKYDSKHLYNIGIPNANGKDVLLPKSMIIQIKLHLNNERNRAHLIGGGLTIPNFEKYIKTGKGLDSMQQIVKGTDARVNAINKKIANELNKETPDFEKIKSWDMDIEQILSEGEAFAKKLETNIDKLLNPWDKRYIETHYKIFDGILKEKLNEKTKLRFGTDLAQEDKYTRLISDPAYLNAMADGAVGIELNQEEAGFMKQRTGARNPIILESCLSADLSQIEKSAKYVGFLIPQHNLNRILKFTSDTEGGDKINLTKVIQQNYPSALDYIDDFKLSVFGGKARPQHNAAVNAVMSIRAIEGLVANVNVELLQAASYPLAASEISYSSLLKGLMRGGKNKHPFSRADRELIDSKTPYLWARAADSMTEVQAAMNNSTIIGNIYSKLANNKYGAYLVGRISKIDNATVGRLWYASEFEVQKNNPRLKKGSEEYYKEVAKIFNKATITTQPMYDALHRNEYQRSNNAIVKMLEMFKTVLVQSYNTVYDKQSKYNQFYNDYKNGEYNTTKEDVKKARKERNRAVVSWLVSMSLVAGIRAVIYSTLYHQVQEDIRDENGDLKADRILKYYADSLLNSFSGAFLVGSDLTEAFEEATDKIAGYDNKYHNKFSLAIVDIAQDAFDVISNSPDLFDEKKRDKYLQDTFNALVRTTGMPYKNTKRLVDGIIGIVKDLEDNGEFDYSNELEGSQKLRKWAKGELEQKQVKDEMTTQKVGNAVKTVYLDGDITKEQAIKKLESSGLYKGTKNRSLSSVLEGKVEKWDIDGYKDEYLSTLTSGGAETAESRAVIQKITNLPYSNAFYSDSSHSNYKNYKSSHTKLLEYIKKWKKSEQ